MVLGHPYPRKVGRTVAKPKEAGKLRLTFSCRIRPDFKMKQLLVISAVGADRPGFVHDLTGLVLNCGGNIVESRMTKLGSEFAMLLLVSGNWHTPTKLEAELDKLSAATGLTVNVRSTRERGSAIDLLPYAVDVVCLDQPGIVFNLANFFTGRGIDISELNTRSYKAAHTGAPMFSVQMNIDIPARIQLSALREEFLEFCDQLNLDAVIEPIKS